MIGLHVSEARLNGYAEGRLSGDELASIERHLAECARCRGLAKDLGALLEQLRVLPHELDTAVDLLPAIRAERRRRTAELRGRAAESRWPMLRPLLWPRAAAAAVLIIAGATFTMLAVRSSLDDGIADRAPDRVSGAVDGNRPEGLSGKAAADGAPLEELRRLEAEYARATGELLAAFREERDRLGPGTARIIEHNIRTVERALRQSRQALSTDPDSRVLHELVLTAHRQRLDVLRRAAVVVSGS